jgi:hypothetical protein
LSLNVDAIARPVLPYPCHRMSLSTQTAQF